MGATELSAQLWKERALVELLLFKLEELELIVADARPRWIPQATKEIEHVLERMGAAGLGRAIDVAEVAQEWGCSPEAALRDLVAAAPPGVWADIFGAHLAAFATLKDEVTTAAATCQRLLRSAMQRTPALGDESAGDAEQALDAAAQDANHRLALAVVARVLQPALADFLR